MRKGFEGTRGDLRKRDQRQDSGSHVRGEIVSVIRGGEVLQLRGAYRSSIAGGMPDIQILGGAWPRHVRVVEQEKRKEETKPSVPWPPCGSFGKFCREAHRGLIYNNSRTAWSGQGDAWRELRDSRKGEIGTGARGAPVPGVGLSLKIKRAQCRKRASRPNEGRVNSQ